MAKEHTDKQGNKLRFIRKNGKVIPIRAKSGRGYTGVKAMKGKKKGRFTRTKKGGVFVSKGADKRMSESGKRGSSAGFKIGGILGGGAAGYMFANTPRGKGVSKLGAALATAVGVGGAALGGGIVGAAVGRVKGRRRQAKKEIKKGNIAIYRKRQKASTTGM
jgi:hypothetical protein